MPKIIVFAKKKGIKLKTASIFNEYSSPNDAKFNEKCYWPHFKPKPERLYTIEESYRRNTGISIKFSFPFSWKLMEDEFIGNAGILDFLEVHEHFLSKKFCINESHGGQHWEKLALLLLF